MFRVGQDYQKPEDYLDGFARFVRDNPEQIEAITILLNRPKEWRTRTLNELREKLARNNYDEKILQRAHKLVHNKALADIISMIKHAALEAEPIFTAEERVDRAMAKVTAGKSYNQEQRQWLGYIRQHLIENLTIDQEDLENVPVFERHGGKGQARKVFSGELEALLAEINYAVAA